MARWEPDAAGRLREAALDLYVERGYEQTTVADIAERAGVTARTFFRHFADKREVLFGATAEVEAAMADAVRTAPADADPLEAAAASYDAAEALFGGDRRHSRRRGSVIAAHPELLERELVKMARIAVALSAALAERGVPQAEARLAAEIAVTVFRVGWERWLAGPADASLAATLREALGQLRTLTG